ncbi:MAG: M23 family metallopeptidase [Candidatus Pacebacteria bacterium]|nr:M23 family metallopeptidase [Candidatus Paceibacterota bacterium]MBP9058309.1 M23 family metallopeptidase [Candidatus Paceibacterota bacterium]MBP9770354.1 M23 family metallopeptidase [Candidatus Paceibacterota bacterium]
MSNLSFLKPKYNKGSALVAGVIFLVGAVVVPGSFILSGQTEKVNARNSGESGELALLEPVTSPVLSSGNIEERLVVVDDHALGRIGNNYTGGVIYEVGETEFAEPTIYIVKKGDTISSIAELFDVSVDTVRLANDIPKGKGVTVGESLFILPVSGGTHKVVKGDSILSIAKKYGADVDEILRFNDLADSSKIKIGDSLIIPGADEEMMKTLSKPKTVIVKKESSGVAGIAKRKSSGTRLEGFFIRPLTPGIGRLSQNIHGNNGVDIAAPVGTPIRASADGVVLISKFREGNPWFGGFGNFVVIEHANGVKTLSAHMSAVNVSVGQNVSQGEVIGKVGNTGRSTGPHIHFEVWGAFNPGSDGSWAN